MVRVVVDHAGGVRCPRCWRYAGIPENPLSLCDRCCATLLASLALDFDGNVPAAGRAAFRSWFAALQEAIRSSYAAQARKYGRDGPVL